MTKLFCVCIGLSQGIFSGTIVTAIIVALNIIPQFLGIIAYEHKMSRIMVWIMCFGITGGSLISLFDIRMGIPQAFLIAAGGFFGIFTGALACAVTEVLNVFPRILEGLNLAQYARICIIVLAISKMAFSVLYWITPQIR